MGPSLAFVQPRGGVGKSTAVAQLAAALAVARPGSTVTVIDASLHADSSYALVGGLQEPQADKDARSLGEEICSKHPTKTTAALFAAATSQSPAVQPTRSGWGRMAATAAAPATPALDVEAHSSRVVDLHPASGAPPNLRIVIGGASLKAVTPEAAVKASQALSAAFAAAPENHIFLLDSDAELCERAASACAAASAAALVLLSSANWADFLRAMSDPVNGITTALAPPFPAKKIVRILFTRCAKTRNEVSGLEGINCFGFKPVNAAMDNIKQIVAYAHSRATGTGALAPYFEATAGLARFVDDHVLAIPDLPETVITQSVLKGTPVAYMRAGGSISADVLGAAQEQLAFAAARLL
jgi:hypothetical protein